MINFNNFCVAEPFRFAIWIANYIFQKSFKSVNWIKVFETFSSLPYSYYESVQR